jgi:cold-inducible RNA-binding protein
MVQNMNIFVGNLPLELTEDQLRQEFSAFGQVKSISLIKERYAGSLQPRLYGYVEMDSRTEGEAAVLNLSGKEIGGRVIEVITALPLSSEKERRPFSHKRGKHSHAGRQPGYQT